MHVDPYIDNNGVLFNKFNAPTNQTLDEIEQAIIPGRVIVLKKQGFKITSVFDILKIHKILFDPIFDWAGEYRTITMYKSEPILEGASVDYTPADYIQTEMTELDNKFRSIEWGKLTNQERIENVAHIIQELWQIHCFREGNTRTVSFFLYFLMEKVGLTVNATFISKHSNYFRNALVLASIYSRSRFEFLIGIIQDSTSIRIFDDSKYKNLNGYDVDKYTYSYHTIEKLKTIKSLQELEKPKND